MISISYSRIWLVLFLVLIPCPVLAALVASETTSRINIANERLSFSISKGTGWIDTLSLDQQDLLGAKVHDEPVPGGPTGNGNSGYGPYLDCYCTTKGFYTPGKHATYKLVQGKDSTGVDFAGSIMTDRNPESGQVMQFYVFLRDTETGLHTFSRLVYKNATGPTRSVLQEFRTLFRPNTPLWTHMMTNNFTIAPLPQRENIKKAEFVQDATLDLSPWPNDPYVKETNKFFTKYSFADTWMDHMAHGLYGDGSQRANGTWGAWMVMSNRETYYGGPLHSDLTVDGIVYDYMGKFLNENRKLILIFQVSNHYGANVPAIKEGFDRTFGPVSR
jgi:rhamnogalacturonan endolyase